MSSGKIKPISKPHLEFIKLVSEGATYEEAYVTICNKKITSGAARVQGSRLASKYSSEIESAREKTQKAIEVAHETKDVQEALKSVLTQAEVDAKLCEIITQNKVDGQKVYTADKLKAIDLYNKRFGANAATKQEVSQVNYNTELTEEEVRLINERLESKC